MNHCLFTDDSGYIESPVHTSPLHPSPMYRPGLLDIYSWISQSHLIYIPLSQTWSSFSGLHLIQQHHPLKKLRSLLDTHLPVAPVFNHHLILIQPPKQISNLASSLYHYQQHHSSPNHQYPSPKITSQLAPLWLVLHFPVKMIF